MNAYLNILVNIFVFIYVYLRFFSGYLIFILYIQIHTLTNDHSMKKYITCSKKIKSNPNISLKDKPKRTFSKMITERFSINSYNY